MIQLVNRIEADESQDGVWMLLHCFGGINRSGTAFCVWMIFRYNLTATEAVESVLMARPSLGPWAGRPHVLWALYTWEEQQNSLFRPRVLNWRILRICKLSVRCALRISETNIPF